MRKISIFMIIICIFSFNNTLFVYSVSKESENSEYRIASIENVLGDWKVVDELNSNNNTYDNKIFSISFNSVSFNGEKWYRPLYLENVNLDYNDFSLDYKIDDNDIKKIISKIGDINKYYKYLIKINDELKKYFYMLNNKYIVIEDENEILLLERINEETDVKVNIDGINYFFDVQPTIINGRTLIPLRKIFEVLGAQVIWDNSTKTVTAVKDDILIMLTINDDTAYVNGEEVLIDVPALIIDSRTMVPLRFISESLEADVDWFSKEKKIVINSNKIVYFRSGEIENIVREKLGTEKKYIMSNDLKSIKELNISNKDIDDLYGIQHIINLEELDISNNNINDINNLKLLNKLKVLDISKNELNSIEVENILNPEVSIINSTDGKEEINIPNNTPTTIPTIEKTELPSSTPTSIQITQVTSLPTASILTTPVPHIVVPTIKETIYVEFQDENFEKLIRKTINKSSGDILKSEVENIKLLDGENSNISNISGIENLKALEYLYLNNNNISDISPLKNIKNIKSLYLGDNKIKDISSLSNKVDLSILSISRNEIEDISPIYSSINIKAVAISTNKIKDISAFRNLKKLDTLYIFSNRISNLEPINELTSLKTLWISNNEIVDIKPLGNLVNLESLSIVGNYIIDISPIEKFTNITEFYFENYDTQTLDEELISKYRNITWTAENIINSVTTPEMTDLQKELAIHDYIISTTEYDWKNYDNDTIPPESYSPVGVLVNHTAVCEGFAETIKILLNMVGIECYYVRGTSSSGESHGWNIVKIDGVYYVLDSTWNQNNNSHKYFNMSNRQALVGHTWNVEDYPTCLTDSKLFEYYMSGKVLYSSDHIYYIDKYKLYKFNIDTKERTQMTDEDVDNINIIGEYIYYINRHDNGNVYRIKLDGNGREQIKFLSAKVLKTFSGELYVLDINNELISKYDVNGNLIQQICSEDIITNFEIINGQIYYRGYNWNNGSSLQRINIDGTDKKIIITNITGFTVKDGGKVYYYYGNFEIYDSNYIYYIDNNGFIYKSNLDGTNSVKLSEEDSSNIEIINSTLIYTEEATGNFKRISI